MGSPSLCAPTRRILRPPWSGRGGLSDLDLFSVSIRAIEKVRRREAGDPSEQEAARRVEVMA